jgi:hypothetical protein
MKHKSHIAHTLIVAGIVLMITDIYAGYSASSNGGVFPTWYGPINSVESVSPVNPSWLLIGGGLALKYLHKG